MWNKLIGVGSFLFTALVLLGSLFLVYAVITLAMDPKAGFPLADSPLGSVLLGIYIVANIGMIVVVIAQIVHAVTNPKFTGGQMIGWAIVLWCFWFVAPLYWYHHMRPRPRADRLERYDD